MTSSIADPEAGLPVENRLFEPLIIIVQRNDPSEFPKVITHSWPVVPYRLFNTHEKGLIRRNTVYGGATVHVPMLFKAPTAWIRIVCTYDPLVGDVWNQLSESYVAGVLEGRNDPFLTRAACRDAVDAPLPMYRVNKLLHKTTADPTRRPPAIFRGESAWCITTAHEYVMAIERAVRFFNLTCWERVAKCGGEVRLPEVPPIDGWKIVW